MFRNDIDYYSFSHSSYYLMKNWHDHQPVPTTIDLLKSRTCIVLRDVLYSGFGEVTKSLFLMNQSIADVYCYFDLFISGKRRGIPNCRSVARCLSLIRNFRFSFSDRTTEDFSFSRSGSSSWRRRRSTRMRRTSSAETRSFKMNKFVRFFGGKFQIWYFWRANFNLT